MVNILIIRNCPVVTLSYLIEAIRKELYRPHIHIFTHEHAAKQVRKIQDVNNVISYHKKDLFHYKYIPGDQLQALKDTNFYRIYFFIEQGQKNGFENLLTLSMKIIPPHGKIMGLTAKGEYVHFSTSKIRKIFRKLYLKKIAAATIFLLLGLSLPPLLTVALLKKRIRQPKKYPSESISCP